MFHAYFKLDPRLIQALRLSLKTWLGTSTLQGLKKACHTQAKLFWLEFQLICTARLLYGWVVKVGMNDGENIHELAFKQLPIFWLSAALLALAPRRGGGGLYFPICTYRKSSWRSRSRFVLLLLQSCI